MLLLLDNALKDLKALSGLVRPHFELLVENLLVLILNVAFVCLVIVLNDFDGFRLERSLEEDFQAIFIHLVLFEIDSEVPVDDIKEDLFKLIELLKLDETAFAGEKMVGIEDIRVELLSHQSRSKYKLVDCLRTDVHLTAAKFYRLAILF